MINRENRDFINDYDSRREAINEKYEKDMQAVLEALNPLIEYNLEYLRYAQAKKWFTITPEQAKETALHNALITLLGRSIKWSVEQARTLSYEILEEVNDHTTAEKFQELLTAT